MLYHLVLQMVPTTREDQYRARRGLGARICDPLDRGVHDLAETRDHYSRASSGVLARADPVRARVTNLCVQLVYGPKPYASRDEPDPHTRWARALDDRPESVQACVSLDRVSSFDDHGRARDHARRDL